jgi:hypothetical protein
MQEIKRRVTSLAATGMYTGEHRSVLLGATHPAHVHQLKAVVRAVDPDAFVLVNPAQEVIGKALSPAKPARQRWYRPLLTSGDPWVPGRRRPQSREVESRPDRLSQRF